MGGAWSEDYYQGRFPAPVMASLDGRALGLLTSDSDDGSAIDAFLETKDFTVPQIYRSELGRWLELEAELSGSTVGVSYSLDQGVSWTSIEAARVLQGGGTWSRERFFLDETSQTIRFKLELNASGGSFSVRWLRVWVRVEGER